MPTFDPWPGWANSGSNGNVVDERNRKRNDLPAEPERPSEWLRRRVSEVCEAASL